MLEKDPHRRPDATAVLRRALRELVSLIGIQEGPRFAVRDELDALSRFLAHDRDEIALMPERQSRYFDDRLKVLNRALCAQRHYETAASRVADIADVERLDPLYTTGAEQTARLERLAQVARDYRIPADQQDLEVLAAVRRQLQIAGPAEHLDQSTLLEALNDALQDAKERGHADALEQAAAELTRVLPTTP